MPRPCAICVHERHEEVDAALLNNEPFQTIAKRFGTSVLTVLTHRNHLSAAPEEATGAQDVARAFEALDQMITLEGNCVTLLQVAEAASELRVVFSAIGQVRRNLETLLALTSQLDKVLKAQT